MNDPNGNGPPPDRRAEQRTEPGAFHSVQVTVPGLATHYMFKLWNVSDHGLCILVKEQSAIVNHLRVGDVLEMTYFRNDPAATSQRLQTRIQHITRNRHGRFAGHLLVGLSTV